MYSDFVAQLEDTLRRPLPGPAAQGLMSPQPPREWREGLNTNTGGIRHAAGLLLAFPRDDRAQIVLTVRADSLGRHGGQISLPGGVIEPGETFERAALREAHEEIGLVIDSVRTLGPLTPIDIRVSGFRLHPIVAAAASRPPFRPSDGEVARILEVSVDALLDRRSVVWRTLTRDDRTIRIPAFVVEDAEIWGATAMVVAEFLSLLGWTGPATA